MGKDSNIRKAKRRWERRRKFKTQQKKAAQANKRQVREAKDNAA